MPTTCSLLSFFKHVHPIPTSSARPTHVCTYIHICACPDQLNRVAAHRRTHFGRAEPSSFMSKKTGSVHLPSVFREGTWGFSCTVHLRSRSRWRLPIFHLVLEITSPARDRAPHPAPSAIQSNADLYLSHIPCSVRRCT